MREASGERSGIRRCQSVTYPHFYYYETIPVLDEDDKLIYDKKKAEKAAAEKAAAEKAAAEKAAAEVAKNKKESSIKITK